MKLEALRAIFKARSPASVGSKMEDRVKAACGAPSHPLLAFRPCERCGAEYGVALESSRTAYEATEGEPDPNRPLALCRPCAKLHHEHWDEVWDHYQTSLL